MRPMLITPDLFIDFAKCKYKASLKVSGNVGIVPEYRRLHEALNREYTKKTLPEVRARFSPTEIVESPPSLRDAMREGASLILRPSTTVADLSATFDAVAKDKRPSQDPEYHPVLFSRFNKISHEDRLRLAFHAIILSEIQGQPPLYGTVIHGTDIHWSKVVLRRPDRLTRVATQAAELLDDLRSAIGLDPQLQWQGLNKHCAHCEFEARCHSKAAESDDLSLLTSITPGQAQKQRERGIFTITQLSYTFRPKSVAGQRTKPPFKHNATLQALAIRERKVYVAHRPELPSATTNVFLDIEGVPDADFYYLVGAKVTKNGDSTFHSFWANTKEDESDIWSNLLSVLGHLDNYAIYHYGTYERKFLDKMKSRYPDSVTDDELLPRIENSLVDVHAMIYGRVYFPVYSQKLKEIGGLLGAEWPHHVTTGAQSVVWRQWWEQSHDPEFRKALIAYNEDDCNALQRVTECLRAIAQESSSFGPLEVAATDSAPDHPARRFGRSANADNPHMERLIDCTYFDYQRKKVCFRTNDSVRRSLRRERRRDKRVLKPNETVECCKPARCPQCLSQDVRAKSKLPDVRKTINDLRFTRTGVKRWVIKYVTRRYYCAKCKKTFLPDEYPKQGQGPKFGNGLLSWAIYSHVALRVSFEDFREALNDVFGYRFSWGILAHIKPVMANRYKSTGEHIREKLLASAALYVDEKKIRIKGNVGYVWVFTNFEEVLFLYSPTREGTLLQSTLEGFSGVVVSDFYSAYDSLECPQQKCLAHLIRDINDAVMENPFDGELGEMASKFTSLMLPIVETIDRFGLKRHFLKKHEKGAEKLLTDICGQKYTSQPATRFQKRFKKYGARMFTFLAKEGVTWDNNAAENSVKLFASRWRLMGATHTETSIKDYLLLLSIYGTLRRKRGSFLRFLLSNELDIDKFLGM
jgi:predicted RecB family nuclease